MLSPTELAAMRATLAASLPDTAQVQRRTIAPDGAGGYSEAWDTVATVACRVSPSGRAPEERVIAERLTAISAWTITLPADTDVRPMDRILVGSRTFVVAGVLARSDEVSRRAVCTEVA